MRLLHSRGLAASSVLVPFLATVVLVTLWPALSTARAQSGPLYHVATTDLPRLKYASADAADYDGDGDLDLVMTGTTTTGAGATRIFRYDSFEVLYGRSGIETVLVTYTEVENALTPLGAGIARWGDIDGDGDQDLLLAGLRDAGNPNSRITEVYRRDEFNLRRDPGIVLPPVSGAAAAWGDYDGDGDLDLVLAGDDGVEWITRIYRNDGNRFVDVEAGLVGVSSGAVAWGDYDGDGDLDLALAGNTTQGLTTRVYRNDAGTFVEAQVLRGVVGGSVSWADDDGDGDLDLLVSGGVLDPGLLRGITLLYRNDAGTFVRQELDLPEVLGPSAWGDYDGDGDLDILLSGPVEVVDAPFNTVLERSGGGFTPVWRQTGLHLSTILWFDCNGDGRLDILTLGELGDESRTLLDVNVQLY